MAKQPEDLVVRIVRDIQHTLAAHTKRFDAVDQRFDRIERRLDEVRSRSVRGNRPQ
jgi:hypothetical protein